MSPHHAEEREDFRCPVCGQLARRVLVTRDPIEMDGSRGYRTHVGVATSAAVVPCGCPLTRDQAEQLRAQWKLMNSREHEATKPDLTPKEAIAALDAVDVGNPEAAHSDAEDILLASVPPEVQAAFVRVRERCRWWVYA